MGPGQLGTWNKVSPPTNSGNHISDGNQGASRPTARFIPSVTASGDVDPMGTHTSEKNVQKMSRGNVRKSKQTTPGDDMGMGSTASWGGRGVGGY